MTTRKTPAKTPAAAKPTPVIAKTDQINVPPVKGPTSRETAADQADAQATAAAATAKAAKARETVVAKYDPAPLGGNEPADVLGRPFTGSVEDRKVQARAAIAERDARVQEDVDRVNHGLEPKHATS